MFRTLNKALLFVFIFSSFAGLAVAQQPDASSLTLERIFTKNEFSQKGVGGFKWLKTGNSYAKLEPSPTIKDSMDLVSYDIATNKRDVLIAAEKLIPAGAEKP